MLTMVNISASRDAWGYLLDSVDEEQTLDRRESKAAYYMENGTPPGRWFGAGLTGLNLAAYAKVNPVALNRLFGAGQHPLTGDDLGKKYFFADPGSDSKRRTSIAGFELVFSPPKSVSAWWGLADPKLKDQIRRAHQDALETTLKRIEQDVARTRIGIGGIAQAEVRGINAAMFDHWDSREGDPQLHTHVLISNRVQGLDGKWRTLDSRGSLTPAISTMSQYYDTVLMDILSQRFGVEWTVQEVEKDPRKYRQWLYETQTVDSATARANFALENGTKLEKLRWQIEGIGKDLREEFSTRAKNISVKKEELVTSFTKKYGRTPTANELIRLSQTATLRTRSRKSHKSLRGLTKDWRSRAKKIVGDTFLFADRIAGKGSSRLNTRNLWSFRADDVNPAVAEEIVGTVLKTLAQGKAAWSVWNAESTVSRLTAGWRFRSVADRTAVIKTLTDQVLNAAVPLTPKTITYTPKKFRTQSGESQFAPKMRELYTTHTVWDAEERLLEASRATTALALTKDQVAEQILIPTSEENRVLSTDQASAVTKILTSGRRVDVLVGPAGAGKTTSLQKLKEIWENQCGAGSVRGLAPTARAAEVLAQSLTIEAETTAKWLYETGRGTTIKDGFNYILTPHSLIIIDEASIAGTMALDQLVADAEKAGAKVLLVGDPAQLASIDAGGAFGMIVNDLPDVPELTNLHRFTAAWEGAASKLLRQGRISGLDPYIAHDRIRWGENDAVLEQAITAWKKDELTLDSHGQALTSLLIAPTNEITDELNLRARAWRIEQGLVDDSKEVILKTGVAGRGDKIVTRQNDRTLKTDHDRWVKNNNEWVVTKIFKNGDIIAAAGAEKVRLPAHYVQDNVQLAYATTAYSSQGRTVDTAHAIVDESATRETFYVAMTRGKQANHAYVVVDDEDSKTESLAPTPHTNSWKEILENVLLRQGRQITAHEIFDTELERLQSVNHLAAEYQTIYATVLEERFLPLLEKLDLVDEQTHNSPYLGPLFANLNRLDYAGENTQQIVESLLKSRSLKTAHNPLAVLHFRIGDYLQKHPKIAPPNLIAGLIPEAAGTLTPDTAQALNERAEAIRLRAELLVDKAIREKAPWLEELGELLPGQEHEWRGRAVAIACYRDLYRVDSSTALGWCDGASFARTADHNFLTPYLKTVPQVAETMPENTAQPPTPDPAPRY